MPEEPEVTLGNGSRLAQYRLEERIGAGGMGEVWRAVDTALGRPVALKILPEALAQDAQRLARFDREARLLASLNHPNIAVIHGLHSAEGIHFLAMELVGGVNLAARIGRGPVAVDEAIAIALQVSEALEAAHEAGIVHRDLKPANIQVTPDGKVKVLDFGLAKALATEPGAQPASTSLSPTVTSAGTIAGVILGTAAYMSPEQARGRAVDRRADIWAFGCVLYEMLSGRRLFDGETVSDIIASVLARPVPLDALPAATPATLRRLLERCLERDPQRRLRDIGEARIALQDVAARGPDDDPAATPAGATPSLVRRPGFLIAATVSAAAIALIAGFVLGSRRGTETPGRAPLRTVRYALQPPPGIEGIWAPAIAPDASFVVYEGRTGGKSVLYLHRFDTMTPRLLEGTEGGVGPFISSDGRWVGYCQGTEIKKVAASGGEPLTIASVRGSFPGAVWRRDGTILFAPSWLGGLATIAAEGGAPKPLTTPDAARGEKGHWWPRLLPDDRHALFTIWRAGSGLNDASVGLIDLASGTYRPLFAGADAWYLPPGLIIYYRAGAYHAVRFDAATLQVTGEATPFLRDVATLDPAGDEFMPLAAGADGTLVYTSSERNHPTRLAWLGPGREPELLPIPARRYVDADLSPDGLTLAASSLEAGRYEIRLLDLRGRTEQRLDLPGSNWTVRWNPRGRGLAYRAMRKGDFDAYMLDIAAGGPEKALLIGGSDEIVRAWTPDGNRLVYTETMIDGTRGWKALPVQPPGEPQPLGDWSPAEGSVAASPDGKWLTYQSNTSGRGEIYVRPFPGPGATTRITRDGGAVPRFAPGGGEIFFLRGDRIMAASYAIEAGRFVPRGERVVLEAPLALESAWINTLDGRRFLVPLRVADPVPPRLQIAMNAAAEFQPAQP
jgi:serine/threonine-protein kinase